MSFPASPSNNQSAIVNNVAYTYSAATNTWTRNAVGGVLNYFNANGALVASNTTVSTSTTTGALQVAGGVGIQGTLNAGQIATTGSIVAGNMYVTSNVSSGSTTRVEANIPHPFLLMGV